MVEWLTLESLILEVGLVTAVSVILGYIFQQRKNARQQKLEARKQVADNAERLTKMEARLVKMEGKIDDVRKCLIVIAKVADKTTTKAHGTEADMHLSEFVSMLENGKK